MLTTLNCMACFSVVHPSGFWLTNGKMHSTGHRLGVSFPHLAAADLVWLAHTLEMAGLQRDLHWKEDVSEVDTTAVITDQRWCAFFTTLDADETVSDDLPSPLIAPKEASSQRFAPWVFDLLTASQLRSLIDGLCHLTDVRVQSRSVLTYSVRFREELVHVGLLAGYSTHFESAKRAESDPTHVQWCVQFDDPNSAFGEAACSPVLHQRREISAESYDGAVWCVTVDHPDHLIVAQRAHRGPDGLVTKSSRSVIVGNCGVVGSRGRREYSVLGDTVNLSARLMQHAMKQGGGVLCDTSTQYSARHRLHFEDNGKISVKGKVDPVLVWQPYSRILAPLYQSEEARAAAAAVAENHTATCDPQATTEPTSPISSHSGAIVADTSSPSNSLLGRDLILVDDETLHLRRKSTTLDPLQLVRAAGPPGQSPPATHPQHMEKTSDTIDAAMLERVTTAAQAGAAVDELTAEAQNLTVPRDPDARRISSTRRSSHESLASTTAGVGVGVGPASSSSEPPAILVPKLSLQNTPQRLMVDIHNFQMEGSVKRHFAMLRSRKEGMAKRAATLNSMDAAVRSSGSPTANATTDLAVLPSSVPSVVSPSHSVAAAAAAVADSHEFNAHLAWFSSAAVFDNVLEGVAPTPEEFARAYPDRASSKRVRGVRVILPDGVGSVVMSTLHLDNVLQLKEELSILCRKRMLLPADACNAAFFLALEDDKLWVGGPTNNNEDGDDAQAAPFQELDSPSTNATTLIDDVLGPPLDRQRTAARQYMAAHASGMASPLSPSGVLSPTPNSPIPEEQPPSPSPSSASVTAAAAPLLPPVTQFDLLTLCLCRSTPDYLLDVLPRKCHDIILHAIEVRLLQERRGGTIVLEGDVGLGKTHLLTGAIFAAQRARPDAQLTLLTTLANPFEMGKPLSCWRDIFLSAIDNEIDRVSEVDATDATYPGGSSGRQSQVRANRRKFVESKLQLRRSVGREGLHLLAPVLNDVLLLDFPETEATRALDQPTRIAHAQNLLIVLMQMFLNPVSSTAAAAAAAATNESSRSSTPRARSFGSLSGGLGGAPAVPGAPSIIVCIDDAVFLDPASWGLVLQMSRQLSGLLLLLSTRPMNRTYQAAFVSGGVPRDYLALLADPQTTHLTMRSRTDAVIYQIASEAFASDKESDDAVQVVSSSSQAAPLINCPPKDRLLPALPAPLAHLILKKAHGSPLVVLELVYNLKKEKLVTLARARDTDPQTGETTMHFHLDPAFDVTAVHNNPLIPVPITLQNILGCRIDRLTHAQRMVLKVGAVIGDEFHFRLVARVYPLALDGDHEATLQREVRGLVELHLLHRVESPSSADADADPDPDSLRYAFTDGFMREMFLSRMLENQKVALEEKVCEARLELFKKKHERVNKSLVPVGGISAGSIGPFVTPIMGSVLYVRDQPPLKPKRSIDGAGDTIAAAHHAPPAAPSASVVAPASSAGDPLEYRLRYFALCANMLFGWVTEEAFLERKDPISIYSLEEAATCEDPSRELGFALRAVVSLDRFHQYATTPVTVRFAALNEKDYESWGLKLYSHVGDKLVLPAVDVPPAVTPPTQGALSEEVQDVRPGALKRSGSVSYLVNPLHTTLVTQPNSTNGSPQASFSIPASLPLAAAMPPLNDDREVVGNKPIPVDVHALSASEKDLWTKKLISAVENRMAPQIMRPALLHVLKHRVNKSGAVANKSGSLFSSEWKQRYVTLIDEALVLRDKKFGEGYTWTKPTQAFSLQVGSPAAVLASVPGDGYDPQRKVYKLTLEVDLWMKGGALEWSRRSVVIGCATHDEAKMLTDRLNELIFKNQVALSQAKQRHQRASTWGNIKAGHARTSTTAGASGHRGSGIVANATVSGRPLPRTTVPPRIKQVSFQASASGGAAAPAAHDSDQDRKLRASQRQKTSLTVANGSGGSEGTLTAPPTPSAGPASPAAHMIPSPSLLPSDLLRVRSASMATPSPFNFSPQRPRSATTSAFVLDSPARENNTEAGATTAAAEEEEAGADATMDADADADPDAEEDRQLDALFSETMHTISTVNGGAAAGADQAQQLLLQLRQQVKSLARAQRARAATAAAFSPSSRTPSLLGDEDGESFAEMVSACDLDDTTRSWLQSTWANDAPSVATSSNGTTPEREREHELRQAHAHAAETAIHPMHASSDEEKQNSSDVHASLVASSRIAVNSSVPLSIAESSFGDLTSWEWSIFDHAADSAQLLPIVGHIFSQFGFLAQFSITPAVFNAWATQVHAEYFDNPFHNFHHAVDVLQTACVILTRFGGSAYLTSLDQFALCVASLCHDLRHTGTGNAYLVNTRSPLALLYNDQSVLENHHAASTFRILERPAFNILSSLSQAEYRAVRSRITLGILSTDMTGHFTMIEKFNSFLDEYSKAAGVGIDGAPVPPNAPSALSEAHRGVIFNVVLHSADISNPAKPWLIQRKWSDAVLAEFFHQGDMERAKGLTISPNCDRETTDQALLSLNFVDFLVAPLFVSLRQLLPPVQVSCRIIKENRSHTETREMTSHANAISPCVTLTMLTFPLRPRRLSLPVSLVVRTSWAALFMASVSSNPRLGSSEKASELARATRRTESFHEIMMPQEELSRRASQEAAAAAAAAQTDSGTTVPASTGATAETVAYQPVRTRTKHAPVFHTHGSTRLLTIGTGGIRTPVSASVPHSAGVAPVALHRHSSPAVVRHASLSSASSAANPIDPRRNSLMVLKQFVSANRSKTRSPTDR